MPSTTIRELIDWDDVHRAIREEEWASELVTETRAATDAWIETYHDDPDRVAGWFHDYNCEACSARLTLDLDSPTAHRCPACGRINTGDKLDYAWNNAYRGRANAMVLNAAILHRIDPAPRYPGYVRRVLEFYAENYDRFIPAPPAKRFEGKIMNQHLDDAVGMMTILLGLDLLRGEFDDRELDNYYERLFSKEAELFDFFATRIYNIPVWIKCAQAMIGVFFDKRDQIDSAFYEKYGIIDQLTRGVTGEGLWYEGSMHYHFYTLQPICYLLLTCKRHGFALEEVAWIYDTVERMFEYPVKMMFRDRSFPNPNDAHPSLAIDNYTTQYEYASVIFDSALIREVCGTFYPDTHQDTSSDGKPKEAQVPRRKGSLNRLLFNRLPKAHGITDFGSVNNKDSYTAMLKSDRTELFLKYGQHTYLHMHPDVMNIEVAFDGDRVIYDLGSGGYASFLFVEWQRKTIAHNTVAVDTMNHRSLTDGIVRSFDRKRNTISVSAKGVYQATNFTRTLAVEDLKVHDRFEVDSRGTYTVDWMLYCRGTIVTDYDTEPVDSLGADDGYQHLYNIRRFTTDDRWHLDFELPDKTIRVSMDGAPGTMVHIVGSHTDSTARPRQGIIVRREAEHTVFDAVHECITKKQEG